MLRHPIQATVILFWLRNYMGRLREELRHISDFRFFYERMSSAIHTLADTFRSGQLGAWNIVFSI
ncbi:hypothetical protein [Photorhabdus temperata]|uniref:hypothetical protein n=1 Tax=Photorhabdus temperata TaxID=574560 RepID=UPI0013E39744|nr:hypothetical protein [Photorhabdus temperata]